LGPAPGIDSGIAPAPAPAPSDEPAPTPAPTLVPTPAPGSPAPTPTPEAVPSPRAPAPAGTGLRASWEGLSVLVYIGLVSIVALPVLGYLGMQRFRSLRARRYYTEVRQTP
jgi:hypothetical protein